MERTADRLILLQLRLALACLLIAVLGGMAASLHYVPSISAAFNAADATLPKLRPIHTTFAATWIFGAGIAVVYHYLSRSHGGLTAGDVRRFWFHTACWTLAGAAILITLAAGVLSGREYLDFHPACSVLLLAGWFAFAWSFLRRLRHGFWAQPIYVYFWTIGILFFVYTFVEGHAYLLPGVAREPVRDLQLQWKSCGTLVGSFNFLVYGSLVWASERLSGDARYGQSRIAFALFGVGCLNSFTNYVHHTYHLPQLGLVKWIAFVVSMLEIVILWRVVADIVNGLRKRGGRPPIAACYLRSAKWWTGAMLFTSMLISVPTLNGFIHGTHVVTGHAMGTELGIDTMILLGASAFLLRDLGGAAAQRLDCARMRVHLGVLNGAMAVLVLWLTVAGTADGITRYFGEPKPDWVLAGRFVFPIAGGVLGLSLLYLLLRWLPALGPGPGPAAAEAEVSVNAE